MDAFLTVAIVIVTAVVNGAVLIALNHAGLRAVRETLAQMKDELRITSNRAIAAHSRLDRQGAPPAGYLGD